MHQVRNRASCILSTKSRQVFGLKLALLTPVLTGDRELAGPDESERGGKNKITPMPIMALHANSDLNELI